MLLNKSVLMVCTILCEGWKWKSFAILMGKIGANSPARFLVGAAQSNLSVFFHYPI